LLKSFGTVIPYTPETPEETKLCFKRYNKIIQEGGYSKDGGQVNRV